ncbi:arsenite methyltransferase [Fibrella sp. WM1]|uniref:arsenite methyltransferase n=1 Tax=Fibrella musci TaxID=3242485 RepID=UPI0035220980
MQTDEQLKTLVRDTYTQVADQSRVVNAASCCGSACGCSPLDDAAIMADDYTDMAGYVADADLGLGCGLPTQFAQIKPGDVVVDLGSGAGNDCFVARAETGETGRVIGLDMTPAMIDRARQNAQKLGYTNVEFVYGDIEDMPLPNNLADVVVSNCVMNLVPNKAQAFAETFRILKPGGHFSISDIVLSGTLPAGIREAAELYAGCVSGAIQEQAYLDTVAQAGFTNIQTQKRKPITLPDDLLTQYLTQTELAAYKDAEIGIFSITVYAEKATAEVSADTTLAGATTGSACCGPDCC